MRNCTGKGRPAKNIVNKRLYERCPRAMSIEDPVSNYYIHLYGECRDHHTLPFGEPPAKQTYFCQQLFAHLDYLVSKHREGQEKDQERQLKRSLDKAKSRGK